MPPSVQAKLLHLLQERECFRLGGDSPVTTNVRIIAATSMHMNEALASKRLREDLYYRLSAFTVQVPALRHRRLEIPLLLDRFMRQLAAQYGLPVRPFSRTVLDACQGYSWPGNLRELESVVKRYVVMGDEELVLNELRRGEENLSVAADLATPENYEPAEDPAAGLRSLVQSVKGEAEKGAIAAALEQTRWNRKAAARLLKVSYRTLLYKIQQYHISPVRDHVSSLVVPGVKGNG